MPISPGYLSVVQSRAREYCRNTGASLIPFGAEITGAVEAIASAARLAAFDPEEVWCAAGSGVLARGLAAAWPKARRHVVQIGRDLTPREVAGAMIHVHPRKFSDRAAMATPFPADPHYDAKAWELCLAKRGPGQVLFWNVAPLAKGSQRLAKTYLPLKDRRSIANWNIVRIEHLLEPRSTSLVRLTCTLPKSLGWLFFSCDL